MIAVTRRDAKHHRLLSNAERKDVMRRTLTAGVLVLLLAGAVVIAGCGDADSGQASAAAAVDDTVLAQGAATESTGADGGALYAGECSSCHGGSGEGGGAGPELTGLGPADGPAVESAVRDGVGSMAPYGDGLTDEQIDAIVDYVVGLD